MKKIQNKSKLRKDVTELVRKRYGIIDLLKFKTFALENKEMPNDVLIVKYNKFFGGLTTLEKINIVIKEIEIIQTPSNTSQ